MCYPSPLKSKLVKDDLEVQGIYPEMVNLLATISECKSKGICLLSEIDNYYTTMLLKSCLVFPEGLLSSCENESGGSKAR